MVAAFDYCLHGRGGAAPSIDTAMHGLVDADPRRPPPSGLGDRVRDRRRRRGPDAGVLRRSRRVGPLATAGLPARPRYRGHPADHPDAIGAILGGHGITAWGDTSDGVRGELARDHPHRRGFIAEHGRPDPVRPVIAGYEALAGRRAPGPGRRPRSRSSAAWPRRTGRRSATTRTSDGRPRLPVARGPPASGGARDVVPRPLPADEGPADGPRPAADGAARGRRSPACASCTRRIATDYARLLRAPRRARLARRCAAPTRRSSSSRASGCSASARTGRPPASPASSTSTPSTSCAAPRPSRPTPRSRSPRSSGSSTGPSRRPSSARLPAPKPLATRVAFVTGGGSGIGKAIAQRLAAEGACVVVADIAGGTADDVAAGIGGPDVALGVPATSPTPTRSPRRWRLPCSPSAGSTSSSTTPASRSRSRCSRRPSTTGTSSTT